MHIDSYEFGRLVIDGREFRRDLLIWPGHIKSDWWRQEAHLLQAGDVAEALAADPQVLVVGTGNPGYLRVDPELEAYLQERGIEVVIKPTREAVPLINDLAGRRRLAAALHLTC
jgi:hypothetical protein